MKVSQQAYEISDSDIESLQQQGFNQEDIWDIGAISALFALSNRLANMANILPNDEFYLLGRIERV